MKKKIIENIKQSQEKWWTNLKSRLARCESIKEGYSEDEIKESYKVPVLDILVQELKPFFDMAGIHFEKKFGFTRMYYPNGKYVCLRHAQTQTSHMIGPLFPVKDGFFFTVNQRVYKSFEEYSDNYIPYDPEIHAGFDVFWFSKNVNVDKMNSLLSFTLHTQNHDSFHFSRDVFRLHGNGIHLFYTTKEDPSEPSFILEIKQEERTRKIEINLHGEEIELKTTEFDNKTKQELVSSTMTGEIGKMTDWIREICHPAKGKSYFESAFVGLEKLFPGIREYLIELYPNVACILDNKGWKENLSITERVSETVGKKLKSTLESVKQATSERYLPLPSAEVLRELQPILDMAGASFEENYTVFYDPNGRAIPLTKQRINDGLFLEPKSRAKGYFYFSVMPPKNDSKEQITLEERDANCSIEWRSPNITIYKQKNRFHFMMSHDVDSLSSTMIGISPKEFCLINDNIYLCYEREEDSSKTHFILHIDRKKPKCKKVEINVEGEKIVLSATALDKTESGKTVSTTITGDVKELENWIAEICHPNEGRSYFENVFIRLERELPGIREYLLGLYPEYACMLEKRKGKEKTPGLDGPELKKFLG